MELEPGARLPPKLSSRPSSGVSRPTVREALRLLAAQGLIRTAKGATGGSYITVPTAGHLSDSLRSGIGLLAATRDVSLDELMEARLLLEVPAARLAARRRSEAAIEQLRAAIPGKPLALGTREQFHRSINDHHRSIVAAIEARDEDAAGGEMHDHVEYLRPYYEKAWREVRRRT